MDACASIRHIGIAEDESDGDGCAEEDILDANCKRGKGGGGGVVVAAAAAVPALGCRSETYLAGTADQWIVTNGSDSLDGGEKRYWTITWMAGHVGNFEAARRFFAAYRE